MPRLRVGLLVLGPLLVLGGCRGSSPVFEVKPEQRYSAVIIGTRIILPTGETNTGGLVINLEGEGGRTASVYRLEVPAGRAMLYPVEPGIYRLAPTRSVFGTHEPVMEILADYKKYRTPFPRQILRKAAIDIMPKKVVPLGIVEVRFTTDPRRKQSKIIVTLDDTMEARRSVLEQIIHNMASGSVPRKERERAFDWSASLDDSLLKLQTEMERRLRYKPMP